MSLVACGLVAVGALFGSDPVPLAGHALRLWREVYDHYSTHPRQSGTEAADWQAAEATWSRRLAHAEARLDPARAARRHLDRAVDQEDRYAALHRFGLSPARVAIAATVERLDAAIAVCDLGGRTAGSLRWQRLVAVRRLADAWRTDRTAAGKHPPPGLRAGEWVEAEFCALDQLAAAETDAVGRAEAGRRRLDRAREIEEFYQERSERGIVRQTATSLATVCRLDAERAWRAATGQPAGASLWHLLVVGRTALPLMRFQRHVPGCFVDPPVSLRTELPMARRLAVARRRADPSPAGRLTAARDWYLTARELEVWYRSKAERGLCRLMVAQDARWHAREAWDELVAATAAHPSDRRSVAAAPADYRGVVREVTPAGYVTFGPADDRLRHPMRLTVCRPGRPDPIGMLVMFREAGAESANDPAAILVPEPGLPNDIRPGDLLRP